MAFDVSRLTRLPLAYYCAAFFGLAVALLILAAPLWQLERGVLASGVHHVIHAAKPPLGLKARSLLALLAGLGTALAIMGPCLILQAIKARKRPPHFYAQTFAAHDTDDVTTDLSPSRRPIFADQELGAPLMSDEVLERAKQKESLGEGSNPAVASDDAQPYRPKYSWLEDAQLSEIALAAPPAPKLATQSAKARPVLATEKAEIADTMSLQDMIARLEAGLASRTPTPPLPPVAQPAPTDYATANALVPPLSVVPSAPQGSQAGESKLDEAMRTLGKLVSGTAR